MQGESDALIKNIAARRLTRNPYATSEKEDPARSIGRWKAYPGQKGAKSQDELTKIVSEKLALIQSFLLGREVTLSAIPAEDYFLLLGYYTHAHKLVDLLYENAPGHIKTVAASLGLRVSTLHGCFASLSSNDLQPRERKLVDSLGLPNSQQLRYSTNLPDSTRLTTAYLIAARLCLAQKIASLAVIRSLVSGVGLRSIEDWDNQYLRFLNLPSVLTLAMVKKRETSRDVSLATLPQLIAYDPDTLFYWDCKASNSAQLLDGGPVMGAGSQSLSRTPGRDQIYQCLLSGIKLLGRELPESNVLTQKLRSYLDGATDFEHKSVSDYLSGMAFSSLAIAVEPAILTAAITLANKVGRSSDRNGSLIDYRPISFLPRRADVDALVRASRSLLHQTSVSLIPYYKQHNNFVNSYVYCQNPGLVVSKESDGIIRPITQIVNSGTTGLGMTRRLSTGSGGTPGISERFPVSVASSVLRNDFDGSNSEITTIISNEFLRAYVGIDAGPIGYFLATVGGVRDARRGALITTNSDGSISLSPLFSKTEEIISAALSRSSFLSKEARADLETAVDKAGRSIKTTSLISLYEFSYFCVDASSVTARTASPTPSNQGRGSAPSFPGDVVAQTNDTIRFSVWSKDDIDAFLRDRSILDGFANY